MKRLISTVLFICLLPVISIAQDDPPITPPVIPNWNFRYWCRSDNGGPSFTMQAMHYPSGSVNMMINNLTEKSFDQLALGDNQAPVIQSVNYANGGTVLDNRHKITNPNGAGFVVTSTDDKAVVMVRLYVDSTLVDTINGPVDGLPDKVRLEWNAKTIAAGVHYFHLESSDLAGNVGQVEWLMVR